MTESALSLEGWQPIEDQTFVDLIGGVYWRDRDGTLEVGMQTDARHRNLSGKVHGGVYMTLCDRALGMTARRMTDFRRMATASLTVNFLRSAEAGDFLIASCNISKNGRKAAFGEAMVRVEGKICCTATGVFMTVEG